MPLNALYLASLARHGLAGDETFDQWVSLHTAAPGDDGAWEIDRPDYARSSPVAPSGRSCLDAVDGADPARVENRDPISFGKSDSDWALTATHLGFWTAERGGIWMGSIELSEPVLIDADEVIRIPAGGLSIVLEAG